MYVYKHTVHVFCISRVLGSCECFPPKELSRIRIIWREGYCCLTQFSKFMCFWTSRLHWLLQTTHYLEAQFTCLGVKSSNATWNRHTRKREHMCDASCGALARCKLCTLQCIIVHICKAMDVCEFLLLSDCLLLYVRHHWVGGHCY